MAHVPLLDPETFDDPEIRAICDWVTQVEGAVPNHFKVELNFPEFFKAKLGATKVLWEAGELSIEEIQQVGIVVSHANGCPYCTAAFCTILDYGLGAGEAAARRLIAEGPSALPQGRARTLLEFALAVNRDAASIRDADVAALRGHGLTDRGIVQLVHLVSDFASYNRLNLALQTEYDYRNLWRQLAFGQGAKAGDPGDDTRGVRGG
jgi:uncharacterized peroxidase-related enzyme